MLTVSVLRSWQPEELAVRARRLRAVAGDVDAGRSRLRSAWTEHLGLAWSGAAARTAAGQATVEQADLLDVVDGLEGCAAALAAGAEAIAQAKARLDEALTTAASAGLVVEEDGSVTVPQAMAAAAGGTAVQQRELEVVRAVAARAAVQAEQALLAATDADQAVAAHLRSALRLAQRVRAGLGLPDSGAASSSQVETALAAATSDVGSVVRDGLSATGPVAVAAWWQENGGGDFSRWDPATMLRPLPLATWRRAVVPAGSSLDVGLPPGRTVMAPAGHYTGGGAITGPDGRSYPLVVPWVGVNADGRPINADVFPEGESDVRILDGRDGGWHTLGVVAGRGSFGEEVGRLTKAAAGVGIAAGGVAPLTRAQPAWLDHMTLGPSGHPTLVEKPTDLYSPTARGRGIREGPAPYEPLVRDGLGRLGQAYEPAMPDRFPTAVRGANVTGLGIDAARGLVEAQHLDDANVRTYQVTFEQNDDGRTRALMRTYQVFDNSALGGGPHDVSANYVTVGADGRLHEDRMSFRPPARPVVGHRPVGD